MQNFELSPWALLSPSAGETDQMGEVQWGIYPSDRLILRATTSNTCKVIQNMVPGCQSTGDNTMFFKELSELAKHSCRNWGHGRNVCEEKQKEQRWKGNFDTFFSEEFFVLLPTSANSPGYGPRMSLYRWNFFFICIETREPAILVDIEVTKETCEEKPPEQISKGNFGVLISTWSVKTLKFKTLKILEELSIAYLKWYFVLLPTPANGLEYSPRVSFYIWAQFLLHKKS